MDLEVTSKTPRVAYYLRGTQVRKWPNEVCVHARGRAVSGSMSPGRS